MNSVAVSCDLGLSLVPVELTHLLELSDDDLVDLALVAEDLAVPTNLRFGLRELGENLVPLERREPLETEIENLLGLNLREFELRHQAGLRGGRVGGSADQRDHGVEVVEGDSEARKYV